MKNTSRFLKYGLVATAFLSLTIAATAESRPDAWITMKAKTALYAASDISGTAVNVDTINGRVTLHGKVTTAQEKTRAGDEVAKIVGVTDVRNLLQVVPSSKAAMVEKSDDVIKTDIEKAYKADRSLDDSTISVKSVNKGVVLLSGKAESAGDNMRALRTARRQPGVVGVSSEIENVDTYADDDFRTEASLKADPKDGSTSRNAGGVMSDMWITSAVKMKLAADSRTPATEINVDTYDGTVTLFGIAPSKASKTAAHDIAHSVSGVKVVENDIEIVSPTRKDAVDVSDDAVTAAVKKALKDQNEKDNSAVSVEVKNGVVRMTGTVPSWQSNLSAVYAVRAVNGVRSVRNDMTVMVAKSASN